MTLGGFINSIQGVYPFHMPGHKRNPAFAGEYARSDITEIHGADNLLAPDGVIAGLQEKLAGLYGAGESLVLVNGSTVGIEAALLYWGAAEIIMARNSHRSAYSGLVLSGGSPRYIYPAVSGRGIAGAVTPADIARALDEAPGAAAVFITSPTFEGQCSDIAAIAETVHARGKALIVDEAHGAHLGFHPAFPQNASRLGADIVIASLHKTLPAPGQCSVMHITGGRVDAKRLKACVNLLQTSSPSYFFMSEIERCAGLLSGGARLFEEYAARLSRFRARVSGLENISLLGGGLFDPGKLTFLMENGRSGVAFGDFLRKRGVELEMCAPSYAVAMTSIADTDEGFRRLAEAAAEADAGLEGGAAWGGGAEGVSLPPPVPAMPPRQAFFAGKRNVPLESAEGMISGGFVIPYPPGVPLIAPGETITGGAVREAARLARAGAPVLGAGEIAVIE